MIGDNNIKELVEIAGVENCLENEPMKKHTTFRIGGARLFISAQSVDVLKKVLVYCREHDIKYFILGNGSNLLVSDKGFDGVIIQIFKNLYIDNKRGKPFACNGRCSVIISCGKGL